jgi:hypothetical protein
MSDHLIERNPIYKFMNENGRTKVLDCYSLFVDSSFRMYSKVRNCRLQKNLTLGKHGHKSRKKRQVIHNQTETPSSFQQRIDYHANPLNLYAGRHHTRISSFSDKWWYPDPWWTKHQYTDVKLVYSSLLIQLNLAIRRRFDNWSRESQSTMAPESPHFLSAFPPWIKADMANFSYQSQVRVPERLPIYWAVPLFVWNRDVPSWWTRPSHYRPRMTIIHQ